MLDDQNKRPPIDRYYMSDSGEKQSLPNPFDSSKSGNISNHEPQLLEGLVRELRENSDNSAMPPNFPSFYPVTYHNINLEIPQKRSFIVRLNYLFAQSICLSLLFSVFAALFSFGIDSCVNSCTSFAGFHFGKEIFLSMVNLVFGVALVFHVQYFPFYAAVRDETPTRSAIPVQVATIAALCVLLAGVPGTGAVGIGYAYIAFKYGKWMNKFFSFVISAWHLLNIVGEAVVFLMMRPIFRTTNLLADGGQITV
ncbi:hypothetical protein TRFO_35689 [Tritrichomonas foetus]|uniref:Transmembrane protein n=1 Tax=Tritrichomonas foetus TaxID=1144522 RepID=A0A1J4JI67_9EUKA|nr:hypothetical protein TRFO_35689 [Tritrichomonas foetus]|eukprot:OHS98007.1 hypothetical protein TRFO_35689 [Tritrichomonas foetus]